MEGPQASKGTLDFPKSLPSYLLSLKGGQIPPIIFRVKSWTSEGQPTATFVSGNPTPFATHSNSFSEHSFYLTISLCGKSNTYHYSHVTREIHQGLTYTG